MGNTNSPRRNLLLEAIELVDGDRNVDYGDPNDDFQKTASYWNIYIKSIFVRMCHQNGLISPDDCNLLHLDEALDQLGELLTPKDVAVMMMQLKMSRLSWSPNNRDHWVDIAGYAACGWDCASDD